MLRRSIAASRVENMKQVHSVNPIVLHGRISSLLLSLSSSLSVTIHYHYPFYRYYFYYYYYYYYYYLHSGEDWVSEPARAISREFSMTFLVIDYLCGEFSAAEDLALK